ncbi:elongation factor P [candidate division WWE3 bacterium RIFCSPHIGHO2_01_FULL_35_17]|uniref:Elongation factor P n=1 Tax=candidate division WWE3 bacterium RIFCSPHIGHO2_01_FULL_35_17 TaxID=1802614 RepID=A0A1F4UPP3_UNCKA|nr:MAG: elongation factor P [candidate division WWE3 bacterium RIFCSPHIGHO2_01_FULL_35_17]
MLNSTDLKNGAVFIYYGNPYKVLQYEHIKMARGGAVVKVKCIDLISLSIKEISFSNNDKVEEADVENRNMQYLYSDSEKLYFMDPVSYVGEEVPVSRASREKKYLIEGREFQVTVFNGKPLGVILPPSIFYKVIEASSAVRGNTSSSATKHVIVENGMSVEVPQFIKEGDVVKINTESGNYTGRGY